MTEISDAALVERYKQLETYVDEQEEALKEKLKPYVEGMDAIKNEFLKRLNQRSPDATKPANTKTEFGTAYRVRTLQSKVVNQQEFLKFCIDNWSTFGPDMLSAKPVAKPLREWLEQNVDPNTKQQYFPPGVEVEWSIGVNIRKS